ncbi:formate dehydrogenase accessory sulfurtransferase FdhD [Parasporobacterium paucivorans]|uniref:Sulfur carrier protein FdhD n=1 Tax=Parasporobacterium paucivorans DSM 15970 TaxID=1122934 RepID=A0A1M6E2Y5_9FIRM|nr:formate dehydrogenase accessory sulfurtransferase FdhD [Parasporobacterium paucivorans]SHI79765.1 FdhD protein [Parasporobacterium paucivorans DSM 15970]
MSDKTQSPYVTKSVRKMSDGVWYESGENIVQEKAVTIYVNSKELATIVCSPWDLKNMAVGFLCSEGILNDKSKLKSLRIDEEKGLVYTEVEGFENAVSGKIFLKRYINPCCGKGRASFYYSSDALICKLVDSDLKISGQQILDLSKELEDRSDIFKETGGVHCSGLADRSEILLFSEDIGRHNTLDKIYGKCFLEDIPTHDKIIVFSGRVSSEILLKAVKMSVSILISRSAPTELALDLAENLGVTVVGFSRDDRCTVFTHPERIL